MGLLLSPNISLRNILFATDFSSSSEAALPYAIALSRRYDSLLNIVSVVPAEICDNAQPPDPFYFRHSAENKMANLVRSGLLQGIKHQELVKEGEEGVRQVLSELMQKLKIDLVVLGTRGRGGMKKVLLGSVAGEIVDSAPRPVLTVGPVASPNPRSELKLRSILYATDLLPGSAKALAYALWLAEQEHAHLTLLHILKMPTDVPLEYPEAETDIAMKRLEKLIPPAAEVSSEAEFIVEIVHRRNTSSR